MPTYDYDCSSCGHRFELFERVDADPRKKCPKCGKRRARRRIGIGAGVVFKGSGFYATDYGGKSGKPKEEAAKGEPAKGPASDQKKTARKKKSGGTEKE